MAKESNKFDFTKKLTKYSAADVVEGCVDDPYFVVKWADKDDSKFEKVALNTPPGQRYYLSGITTRAVPIAIPLHLNST